MKRYCIFAAQFLPHLGGVERYTYNLAQKLIEKGNEVTVVTSDISSKTNYEVIDKIKVFRLPSINLLDGRYPVLKFWTGTYRRLYKKIEKEQYDMVIVNTRFYLHSICGVRYAKRHNQRAIVIDHGTSHLSVHNRILDAVGGAWEHFITRIDYHYCKEYYGVSEASCEWLKHFGINANGVLYNAIDLDAIELIKKNKKADFRQIYNIPSSARVIAFTGRLLEEKGIIPLIESVEQLCAQRDDVYLFLAGDGDLNEYVKEHQAEHIIPLGRLAFEDIISMLSDSDIFCLPSFSEGFSTSVLEAVACGCYVITTERGGSKEMITSREYGMIIKNNEKQRVYDALIEIIDKDDEREMACIKCYDKLKSNYTWDIVSDKVIELT